MAIRKKATTKKKATQSTRKKTAKKPAAKKRTVSRKKAPARRKPASAGTAAVKRPIVIEPGPPAGSVPSVEEPTVQEAAVGVVTHYYGHLGVAVVQINTGTLSAGDTIHVKGHTTDLTQQIASMEYEHQHVDAATPGQSVGIKVADHVREHDIVFVVK